MQIFWMYLQLQFFWLLKTTHKIKKNLILLLSKYLVLTKK